MKKSQALLLWTVLLLASFVLGLWFQSHRLLSSAKLHESLIQRVQTLTEGTLKYQSIRVGYFPQPQLVFEHVQLIFSDRPFSVEAEKIKFDFNILPLFFGQVEPVAFYAQSGKAELSLPGMNFLNPVRFENFLLQIGTIRPKIPIPFHFSTDMAGKPNALVIKGNVVLDSVEQWNWEKTSGAMVVELKGLLLDGLAKGLAPDPKRVFLFKGGQIDTSVEVKKKAHEAFLEFTVTGAGKGLAYEVSQEGAWIESPALDAEWNVTAAWNNDTSELKLHRGLVKLPFGEIETNGSMKLNTGEISGMHATGSNMVLEDLLRYWPGLENALPFHIGFSGPGKWVLSMEGTLDHLSLHFGWDLAQVLLSYGQYFTKPKDLPLDLSFDLLLQKGAMLGGDFAVKFKELSMKGNLKSLDLKTGEGQLNLITNKFSVTGWEQYIPALQGYKLEGDAKLMANWKGDLRRLEKAEHIFNISFDKASWTIPEGPGFHNASLSLDYSPLMLEGRKMQFEIGGSPVMADLKVSGFPEKPEVIVKIFSGALKPLEVWQAVAALLRRRDVGIGANAYDRVKEFIQTICPKDQIFKNVLADVLYKGGVWSVPALQFEGYGGKANLKGKWNFKDKKSEYRLEGEFHGVDLGLFLGRQNADQKVLEGALDLKCSMTGTGWGAEAWGKSLAGQGEWTLKNGKFLTFDLKDALSTIEPFKKFKEIRSSLKDFDSMNFMWKISDGKVTTDNLLVKSKDYVIDGEGTLGFDGLANFRLDVFLSSELGMRLLPEMASSFKETPQAHLGPVSMLFSGSLLAPEVKSDPAQTEELTKKIRHGEAKDFLYELVTE
ncbi:MAG: AsmA-like C-terminal region-containing protein [Candidatus Omnitrophota bacterium]